MKGLITIVPLLLVGFAPLSGAQPMPSGDQFDGALALAHKQAAGSFLAHQPGKPYLDAAVRLPPAPADAAKAAQLTEFAAALRDVRSVQEGCALPCASKSDVALYLEKVKVAAASLNIPADGITAAVEHYAPKGVPRKRAAPGAGTPNAIEARALAALLSRPDLPPDARSAFTAHAAAMAAALDQHKAAENVPGGAAVATSPTLSSAERARLLDAYRAAPSGDSSRLQTLKIVAPPAPQARHPYIPEPLTNMEKFALWVDDKVGSKNIETASNFSAGFGDSMSFGITHWVRGKMGTNAFVNDGSGAYLGGGMSALALSLMIGGAGILKPFNGAVQQVGRWAPTLAEDGSAVLKEGQFVMAGNGRGIAGAWNWLKAGGPELAWKAGPRYLTSVTTEVPGNLLRYPIQEEGQVMGFVKGLMGQRVYVGPSVVVP